MFQFTTPDAFDQLREALRRASYNEAAILEMSGVQDLARIRDRSVSILMARTSHAGPLGTLVRLWIMGVAVATADVRAALAPLPLEEALCADLVRLDRDTCIPMIQLIPFRRFFLAADLPLSRQRRASPDFVMGIGSSSITLANATVRRQIRSALDIGTGSGIHAFLAASHAAHVIGVDLNPRAIALARFNANLNGIDNVEFVQGDMLHPVAGRSFDLVVANPPFVISPESTYIYRDGGAEADGVTQRVTREMPTVMNDGAFGHMICNWAHAKGQPWQERIAQWVKGSGCDVLVLKSATLSPRDYAETWIDHTEYDEPDAFARRLDAWLANFERHEIEAVSAGLILMRKRAGETWYAAEDSPQSMKGPAGDAFAAAFDARTLLHSRPGPDALCALRLRASPDASLTHELRNIQDAWRIESISMRLNRGGAYDASLDAYLNAIILRCDGSRTLVDIANEIAQAFNVKPRELAAAMEDPVRQLIARGFLEVVG